MKIKLNLRNKMQLYLITASVAIYVIAIGYISVNAKKAAYNDSVEIVNTYVEKYAFQIQSDMNEYFATVRTLAKAFSIYNTMPKQTWDPLFNKMYDKVYRDNSEFYKLWDSWELNKFDQNWTKPTGRIANVYSRINGVVHFKQDIRSLDGDPAVYAYIKQNAKELVLPIYFDVYTDELEDTKLMTSLVSPIIVDNQYHGMIGVDLILEKFQDMVEKIKVKQFEGSYAFLLSQEAKYAGHPKTELLNQAAEFTLKTGEKFDLLNAFNKDEQFSIITKDEANSTHFVAFAPIKIGRTNTPWYIGLSVPTNSIMAMADRNFMISILVGICGIIILGLIIYFITKNISDPIQKITEFLNLLAKGKTSVKMAFNVNTGDEIEEMSKALNTSIIELNKKTDFANQIGLGNLDHEFKLVSDEDELGIALINMRNSLTQARAEEEKRKIEDEKRRWANEGLAKFADILRQNNNDLEKLSNEIIKNLVYYLNANQGGIFLLNDDDKNHQFLQLISAFAYDSKKFVERTIELGDGIVGTCAIERETIYMTDIPQDYISITSGLGGANPDSLLIVPLNMEDKIYGVIELASFKKFEDYQIDFVEKVGQNIASTLSSVQINIKTNELLEKFQQQSEEMAAQEEEMRQNMEELQATQEEAARKGAEMESLIHALDQSSYVIEYDLDGYITKANDNYLNLLNMKRSDIIGVHHADKMEFDDQQKTEYNKFWTDLRLGKTRKERTRATVNGKTYHFFEIYSPLFDENGTVTKILKISHELSDFK
jgi:PAS domain-containing protein/HAMP domain-containing protein